MGSYEEREYGVFSFRIGERRHSVRSSIFKDKIEVITDGNGSLTSLTNRDLLLRFRNPSDIDDIAIIEIGKQAFMDSVNLVTLDITSPIELIGEEAFKGCTSLRSVSLPNTLQELEKGAFENCTMLESIDLPESVDTIGSKAFDNCRRLRSISFSHKDLNLGTMCFASTGLESVRIPFTREIPDGAFMGSELKVIELPSTVRRIGASAFSRCRNLSAIYFDGTLDKLRKVEFGIYWNKGIPEDAALYVRDSKGRWYNAFGSKDLNQSKRSRAMEVLGLGENDLSRDRITRAFREKSRRFHPDVIAPYNLDPEFSLFASEKFRELKDAFDYLISTIK